MPQGAGELAAAMGDAAGTPAWRVPPLFICPFIWLALVSLCTYDFIFAAQLFLGL